MVTPYNLSLRFLIDQKPGLDDFNDEMIFFDRSTILKTAAASASGTSNRDSPLAGAGEGRRMARSGKKSAPSSSHGVSHYLFWFGRSRISDRKVTVQERGTEAGLKHCLSSHAW